MTTRRFEWHRWAAVTPDEPGTFAPVPFASAGWRYLVTTETDDTSHAAAALDDTAWSVGAAPFSNGIDSAHTGQGWPAQGTTLASASSTLWLRRTVYAPGPGSAVRIGVRVDGAVRVYWNGALVADPGEGWSFLNLQGVTIPAADVEAVNVLAIRYRDDAADPLGDYTYADAELTELLPATGTPYADEVTADSPLGYWRQDDAACAPVSVATSSSNFGSEPPANAFDGRSDTHFTTSGTATGWLRAQLPAPTVLGGYAIARRNDIPNRNPTAWTFEGSNDGTAWTVLDTRSGVTWPTAGEVKAFTFANAAAFLYYRLNVTANGGDTYLSVADLYLGTMEDASSNGRRGVAHGARTPAASLLADGSSPSSDYGLSARATVPYGAWMNTARFTVDALIVCPPLGGYHAIAARDPSGGRCWQFRITPTGKLEALIWLTTGYLRECTSPASLTPGTTYHVAVTYDGAAIRLYVDGLLFHEVTGAPYVGDLATAPTPLTVGADSYTVGAGFGAALDEVAFYGTALPAARIAAHAAAVDYAGAPALDPDPDPAPGELVEGWVLDEDRSKALFTFTTTHGGPESSVGLQLAAPLAPIAPDLGERFRITLTEAARTALGITEAAAPRFTGEVTDAVSDADWHTVSGMGRWAKHGRYPLNGKGYPREDDGARVARILAATRSADDVGTIDPGTSQLLPHPEPAPAAALVTQVAESTTGRLIEQRDGTLDWHDADHRRGSTPVIELTAAEVFGPGFTWAKRVGDLVNDATVSYGTAGKDVHVRDAESVDARGPYPQQVGTVLVDESAAFELGAMLVSRRATPSWQLPAVQVDLTRTVLDPARTAILAGLRHGDRIKVTGLPPSPDAAAITEAELFVELVTETAFRSPGTHDVPARDGWRLVLSVSDPARSGVALRWVDLPVGLAWTELAPGLSWLDLGRIESPDDPALTTT